MSLTISTIQFNPTGFAPAANPLLGAPGAADRLFMEAVAVQQVQQQQAFAGHLLGRVVGLLAGLMTGGQGLQGLGHGLPGAGAGMGEAAGQAAGQMAQGLSAAGGTTSAGAPNADKIVAALPSEYQSAAKKHFPGILAECQKQGVTDKAQIAYILATTVHESGAGAHMEEFASGEAYEGRSDLGNNQPGDGKKYKGRGYVQITGRNNYTDWGKRLGIDLVNNPELAEQPQYAARILVQGMKEGTFTGKKLSDYIGGGKQDFEGARRIVNGTDKAAKFAETARKILAAM